MSSSSEELHDIDWESDLHVFTYEDPLLESPQVSAVLRNDVPTLASLLQSGRSVNINDNLGNTPLHVAVLKNKKEAFDFLLTVEDIRLDVENFEGLSPLEAAIFQQNAYYASELIKKGANCNVVGRSDVESPLHLAVWYLPGVCGELIENGADINRRNALEETPLFRACQSATVESVHVLMCYGAEPRIPNIERLLPFDVSNPEIQEILFDYTFHKQDCVNLETVLQAMIKKSPFFEKINEFSLVYDLKDLEKLEENLMRIPTDLFLSFMERHKELVEEFFLIYNPIEMFKSVKNLGVFNFEQFFYHVGHTLLMEKIIRTYRYKTQRSLANLCYSEDTLTKIILFLLSCGVGITVFDLERVYESFGYSNLFKILLHMEMTWIQGAPPTVTIPRLLTNFSLSDRLSIRKFGGVDSLKHFFTWEESKVSSLLELSRNCALKYLISRYKIQNNVQLMTLLRWLPISDVYKAILSYEKPIYF